MACPSCGATASVHGDCPVCDAPFGAPRGRTVYVCERGPAFATREPAAETAAAVDALADRWPAAVVERHLSGLPPSYVRRMAPDTIAAHIALIERAAGGTAIEHTRARGVDRITVVTNDRPRLLELLAGTLTVRSINIAGAIAYTRDDGVVIDDIDVTAAASSGFANDSYWSGVCADLRRALAGETAPGCAGSRGDGGSPPAADRPQIPTMVYVHNAPDERSSRVEVNAADRPGLLYAITRAMREQSLNVRLAEVETIGALAVDTFYVVNREGGRIEAPEAIEQLTTAIRTQIASLGCGQ